MSIAMLERAALELAPFLDEVAFEVATRVAWYRFEERLRAHGLRNDMSSPVICRWRAGGPGDELVIDLMPGDAAILGFENRWQKPALEHAKNVSLPSGKRIRVIPPPYLLATKLEAWNGRGGGDHLRSHDLKDIITLIDGRDEVAGEVEDAPGDLREFLSREIANLLNQPRFLDAIDGTVVGFGRGGPGSGFDDADRVDEVFLPRIRALAGQ